MPPSGPRRRSPNRRWRASNVTGMPRRRTVLLIAGALVAAGGSGAGVGWALAGGGPSPSRAAADRACGRPYVELLAASPPAKGRRTLEKVGHVEEPTALVLRPGRGDDGLLASRTGEVRRVAAGEITDDVVLDLRDDTVDEGDGGLLALAYDPGAAWLYAYRTTAAQDEEITAYPIDAEGVPDPEAGRVILSVDHPASQQHHGGGFGFGPDGFLYIGLGDGGGLGDPRENAQDPGSLLGKVVRIDPTPTAAEPYAVPLDNPFVGRAGWRPEIWALGVRNPFRLTFDAATGDLWLGDVGQSCWEELDRLAAGTGGANLGWDVR